MLSQLYITISCSLLLRCNCTGCPHSPHCAFHVKHCHFSDRSVGFTVFFMTVGVASGITTAKCGGQCLNESLLN